MEVQVEGQVGLGGSRGAGCALGGRPSAQKLMLESFQKRVKSVLDVVKQVLQILHDHVHETSPCASGLLVPALFFTPSEVHLDSPCATKVRLHLDLDSPCATKYQI